MTSSGLAVSARMAELVSQRVPFVHATVVRAQHPTSARPGDQAIVLADGSIEGFVGGHCATGSVRTAALGVLQDGESMLLRVLPDDNDTFPESPGASVVVNPCLSGGALEIFLEPTLPSPLLHLVGDTPTADAVATLAETVGFVISRATHVTTPDGALAAVISSHGGDEAGSIRRALDAGTPYVGLVASKTRGDALVAELGLTDDERARMHTPVGLDIGARTPQEIALSIVAELVRAVRRDGLTAAGQASQTSQTRQSSSPPAIAVDPVCGMSVTIMTDTPHLHLDSEDFWFCGVGCRDAYQRSH